MLCGRPPINGKNASEIIENIKNAKKISFAPLSNLCSFECVDFLKNMLTIESDFRMSPESLLKHPWLKN